ncbi:MAG: hypothetical protein HC906_12495 [Bacteroidales bacterium]|nr:hypothetical protein [Bacteroidales bacterium]
MRDITERRKTEYKKLNTIIEIEDRERKRFARDIHDGLGPLLSALRLYIDSITSAKYKPADKKTMVINAKGVIDKAIESTREIANNIMPNILTNFGLTEALQTFCADFNRSGAIEIKIKSNILKDDLNKNQEVALYRVLTELINNTIKHAGAKHILVELYIKKDKVNITYQDDGKGMNTNDLQNSDKQGMGIGNMYSRLYSLNGVLKIETAPEKGFKAHISIRM